MGYYTQFSFDLIEGPEEQFNELLKDIDEMLDTDSEIMDTHAVLTKWYSRDEDLKALSVKYPDIFFRVLGRGEEDLDLWQQYWHAGKCFSEGVQFKSFKEIRNKIC